MGPALPGGASDAALSPDGTKVFVIGSNPAGYGTLAYRTATGARLWVAN